MRCPDCNKFVPFDTDQDPDVSGEDFDAENNTATCDVRIVNTCEECGTELTESTFNVEVEVIVPHTEPCGGTEDADSDISYEVDVDVSRTLRTQGVGRSAKTFYGVEGTVIVTCGGCRAVGTGTFTDEVQASFMDSLV